MPSSKRKPPARRRGRERRADGAPRTAASRRLGSRTTVAVSTANMYAPHAAECLRRIKQHSEEIDLIVLDNNGSQAFSHPRDMNQTLKSVSTRYVALLDDDVFVTPGWLPGLLSALDDQTGVALPLHADAAGNLAFSGCYISGSPTGFHAHLVDRPAARRVTGCYCSAAMLIDMEKVGHIRMDQRYEKYFFDIVHGLEVWEAGFQAVVTPAVTVTHLGGATALRGTDAFNAVWQRDGARFAEAWLMSGRLARLEEGLWQQHADLRRLLQTRDTIRTVMARLRQEPAERLSPLLLSLAIAHREAVSFRPMLIEEMALSGAAAEEAGDPDRARRFFAVASMLQRDPDKLEAQPAAQVTKCRDMVERFLAGAR